MCRMSSMMYIYYDPLQKKLKYFSEVVILKKNMFFLLRPNFRFLYNFFFVRPIYDDRHVERQPNEHPAHDCHRWMDQLDFLWICHQ